MADSFINSVARQTSPLLGISMPEESVHPRVGRAIRMRSWYYCTVTLRDMAVLAMFADMSVLDSHGFPTDYVPVQSRHDPRQKWRSFQFKVTIQRTERSQHPKMVPLFEVPEVVRSTLLIKIARLLGTCEWGDFTMYLTPLHLYG